MTDFRVAIRVDSGLPMGSGHLMRCLTLANELRRRGASVRFLSRAHPSNLIMRIEDEGFRVDRLAAPLGPVAGVNASREWLGVPACQDAHESLAILAAEGVDLLIVDHYGIDAEWERLLRAVAKKILVIDDLADRPHDADYIVDQSYERGGAGERYRPLAPPSAQTLLGPRYALLQPVYRELRKVLASRGGVVRRILVFFGAHDPSRSVLKVAKVLAEPQFREYAIDIVPGNDPEIGAALQEMFAARANVSIHASLPSLAGLMMRADLAVGAGGTTTLERACLGLPAIVATIAENQVSIAAALAADGMIVLAGSAEHVTSDAWRTLLTASLTDAGRLAEIERRSRTLTDGFGAVRVARRLMGKQSSHLTLRRATAQDEALLLEWANDPEVRRRAFSQAPIDAETHHRWFTRRLRDPDCLILVGEDDYGLPLGQVRFDVDHAVAEAIIDISVDQDARGCGIGRTLLEQAVERWRSLFPALRPTAEVLIDNAPSQRLFEATGFRRRAARHAGSVGYEYLG